MQNERSGFRVADDGVVERAIVLSVLTADRDVRWSFEELEGELYDLRPEAIRAGANRLERQGVVHLIAGLVIASRCAHCLDQHGLISA